MHSVMRSKSTRNSQRVRPKITHRSPTLSTQEAASLVIGIVSARLEEGWNLDQIGWQHYCRDSAVVHVVTQQLATSSRTTQEV